MSAGDVTVIAEESAWKKSGVTPARVKAAARLALGAPPNAGAEKRSASRLTILLSSDAHLRLLNAQFRGKDSPTNVLSFAAVGDDDYLGDVAIAFGVTSRESAASGVSLEAHTLHLAVHGVLHLLGYDHVRSREARMMERLETAILADLGISNPYKAARHKNHK
jgi:probable rRNA maturation factor